MSRVLLAHLAAVCAYAGFQWTVHVVVYPQFAGVPAPAFTAYEVAHQRRLSRVVGPLFGALLVTTALLVVAAGGGSVPSWGAAASVVLLGAILGITALAAVPLHRRLGAGWDESAHRSLGRVDAVRLAAATANVAVAAAMALGPTRAG